MPPLKIALDGQTLTIPAVPLTPSAFAPFGDVIQNPHPAIAPSPSLPKTLALNAIAANQGSAIKYQHPSTPANHYPSAPSHVPEKPVINLFVCATRPLEHPDPATPPPISTLLPYTPVVHHGPGLFRVRVLERHPFTTQTFSPLAPPPSCAYLVIVAPSLAPAAADEAFSAPPPASASTPGRGLPDLARLRAFVATGAQAVTYGAGTWHAPMVALGPAGAAVEFVVTQFANGVADEDCQEVVFGEAADADGSVVVQVPERSGLGGLARL